MSLYDLFLKCITLKYSNTGVSINYTSFKQNDVLYIFFQGSNSFADWLKNLNFPAKPYKKMGNTVWFAHKGFLKAWKQLEGIVQNLIADKTIKQIIITGYSHGAAIAVLCHEYVWFNRPDLQQNLKSFGFGCPRVIWGVKTLQTKKRWKNFTVIRNLDDIVTYLPPFIFGYIHVGTMLKIGERKKYTPVQAHYPINILKELKTCTVCLKQI